MERDRLVTAWSVAEALYAHRRPLQAFLLLYHLLHGGNDAVAGHATADAGPHHRVAFPAHLKRDEVATRVRAVEYLLYDPHAAQSGAPVPGRAARREALGLAQELLTPLFAHRTLDPSLSHDSALTSSSYAGNEYFFSPVNVQGVTWQASAFTLHVPAAVVPESGSTSTDTTAEQQNSILTFVQASACGTVPLALLLRAYLLQATVCARQGQHKRALSCLRAAERWTRTTLREPQLSCTVRDLCDELRGRRRVDGDGDTERTDAVAAAVQEALPEALQTVLGHERVYCEALLATAFCHVLHAVLNTTYTLPRGAQSGSQLRVVDFAQRHREYGETIQLLGSYAAVYGSLLKAATTQTGAARVDLERRAWLTHAVRSRVHTACLCCIRDDVECAPTFPLRAVAAVLGCYHGLAGVYLLCHRPRPTSREDGLGRRTPTVCASLLRHHLARCVRVFANDELALLERLYRLGACEELAQLRPTLLAQLHTLDTARAVTSVKLEHGKRARDDEDVAVASWTIPGLRRALDLLLLLWGLTHGIANTPSSPTTELGLWDRVRGVYDRVMDTVEATLAHLGGQSVKESSSHVTHDDDDMVYDGASYLWHASALAQTHLLVHVKAAALVMLAGFALTELQLVRAVRAVAELQQLMTLFQPRLRVWRVETHLVLACIAMSISLREVPTSACLTRTASADALWHDVAHDVGLPYAHLLAAEDDAVHSLRGSPATRLLIQLLQALALYQVPAVGEKLELGTAAVSSSAVLSSQRIARLAHATSEGPAVNGGDKVGRWQRGTYNRSSVQPQLRQLPPDSATKSATDTGRECGLYAVRSMPTTQRQRCAAALQSLMSVLRSHHECYLATQQPTSEVVNNDDSALTAWTPSNVVLFELLQGLVALGEDADGAAAMQHFRRATHDAKRWLGTLSPLVADGLQWLAVAAAGQRSSQPTPPASSAERVAAVALHVALHANWTSLWHLQHAAPLGNGGGGCTGDTATCTEAHALDELPQHPTPAPDMQAVWRAQVAQLMAAPAQLMLVLGVLPGTPAYGG